MYSEAELEAAVAAGAISPEAAAALRRFVAGQRAAPMADEEQFRLLTGFNDIFVAIALVLLLVALGALGARVALTLGAALVAAASWGLAEFFTRRRRMALPSILLLASFVGAMAVLGLVAGTAATGNGPETVRIVVAAGFAVVSAAAHWGRFHVPVTLAVGASAAVGGAVALLSALVPGLAAHWPLLLLGGGLLVFGQAMSWDMSDPARETRRADVAFWLHLAAAPMIVHPVFALLGLLGAAPGEGLGRAAAAVAVYLVLALVALVVDRRALLVSALFYVLYAISALLRAAGALEISLTLTALVVGSGLLALSAFWHAARALVLGWVPAALRARVPAGARMMAGEASPRGS